MSDTQVTVISEQQDGAELRRLQQGHYVRCDGRDDAQPINEAVQYAARGKIYAGLGDAWERIFGKDKPR